MHRFQNKGARKSPRAHRGQSPSEREKIRPPRIDESHYPHNAKSRQGTMARIMKASPSRKRYGAGQVAQDLGKDIEPDPLGFQGFKGKLPGSAGTMRKEEGDPGSAEGQRQVTKSC